MAELGKKACGNDWSGLVLRSTVLFRLWPSCSDGANRSLTIHLCFHQQHHIFPDRQLKLRVHVSLENHLTLANNSTQPLAATSNSITMDQLLAANT